MELISQKKKKELKLEKIVRKIMLVYLFDPPEPNPARPLSKSNLILKITIHTDTNPI